MSVSNLSKIDGDDMTVAKNIVTKICSDIVARTKMTLK